MNVAPHLVRHYIKTTRRYKKLISKLQRETVSTYRRKTFLHQLRKLLKKLRDLHAQLKIAAITGTVVLMLNTSPVQAQSPEPPASALGPFVKQNRLSNPLREPLLTNDEPAVTVADFDGDGDFDVVVGEYDYWNGGHLRYFENQTTEGTPIYLELLDEANPFNGIRATTSGVAPALADIDQDGDLDLILGQNGWYSYYQTSYRGIEYYRNDGGNFSKQTGDWDETTKQGNPFEGISLGDDVRPAFVDLDKDGDLDMVVGSYFWIGAPVYSVQYIHYYENNGSGTFTSAPLNMDSDPNSWGTLSPAFADVDKDGDYDMVLGTYQYEFVLYYRQDTPGNFVLETDPWDPLLKTGNPFRDFQVGANASPAFIDFNNDGNMDLFVADEEGYNKYSDHIINYYENSDTDVFAERKGLENPFDGVYVKRHASPVLVDLDGDTELDAVVGNKYQNGIYDYDLQQWIYTYSRLSLYKKNEDGHFNKVTGEEENPYNDLEIEGYFAPQFADVDGDSDLDIISGGDYGQVVYFRNDDGIYNREIELSPFANVVVERNAAAKLVDLDNDGDTDLFMTDGYGDIRYFVNDGSATDPSFAEQIGGHPLDVARDFFPSGRTAFLHFTDIDHDGDFDVFFNGFDGYYQRGYQILYLENTGTKELPVFELPYAGLFKDIADTSPQTYFVDYDKDGDLDTFVGNYDGTVSYLQNQNEVVNTAVSGTVVEYDTDGDPVIVEPALTLEDPDNDTIIQATVAIEDFQPAETLSFTPSDGISGVFDTSTGILTFRGKATVMEYQTILRTVSFEVTGAGGREGSPKKSVVQKTISFAVYDQDFTNPQVASKSLEIFINDPPAINGQTINFTVGGSAAIDLKLLISDPNGVEDLDISSLKVIQEPVSGAVTSLDGSGILTVSYDALTFTGTETMTVEVCDLDGACTQNILTLIVTNTPPTILPEPVTTTAGETKSVNLMSITSDVDDNLDPTAFSIIEPPSSGAQASIVIVSPTVVNLVLNYGGITFNGIDELTIGACDLAGACVQNLLAIDVDVTAEVVVYNAVAPNSTGDNRFMRITGLSGNNKVSIFNRWGDKVFDTENYQNTPGGNAFMGVNNQGNALPSGTYFYTIEQPGKRIITGYLTLKQ